MQKVPKLCDNGESSAVDVRVPSESEILENPRRAEFLGGGWVDSSDLSVVNLYWHRKPGLFTVYSLLQILEHETLHSVLARRLSIQLSMKLDRVHRSSCAWIDEDRLVFINEFKIGGEWVLPPYFEEPSDESQE